MRRLSLALLLLAPTCTSTPPPRETPPSLPHPAAVRDLATAPASVLDPALESALARIAAQSDGRVAVTVLHLGTGVRASVSGGARLPMMSVFKLPLAVATFAAIEDRKWQLETPIPIAASELRRTVSPIADAWEKGERSPTLETMLRRVLQDSDNTAGDKLVTLNGGGPTITARLRTMGISGIDIAEEEIDIAARIECAGVARPASGWAGAIDACPKASPEAQLAAAQHEIAASPNGATTDGLVDLLARLDRGSILSPSSQRWLLSTLAGTKTGPARLKGLLPPGTPVAHKTGTGETVGGMTIATNDVGIVTLPGGSRFAIAVLTAGSHGDQAAREATIARFAKTAWDAFSK